MNTEARRFQFRETGGPLFGFGDDDALVVVAAGGPGPNARHRPMSFTPDRFAVARAIDHVWDAGEQRYRYLGSWHTHPFGRAAPSTRDTDTARGMANDADVALARPLILIQATRPGRRVIRDVDLRAHHWLPADDALIATEIRILRDEECEWPEIELK